MSEIYKGNETIVLVPNEEDDKVYVCGVDYRNYVLDLGKNLTIYFVDCF